MPPSLIFALLFLKSLVVVIAEGFGAFPFVESTFFIGKFLLIAIVKVCDVSGDSFARHDFILFQNGGLMNLFGHKCVARSV